MRKGFMEKIWKKCLFEVKGNQEACFDKHISQKFSKPFVKVRTMSGKLSSPAFSWYHLKKETH